MKSIFNGASGVFAQISAKLKEDFQDGYMNARRKFENTLAVPLAYGIGASAFYGCMKLASIEMLQAELEVIEEGVAAFGMGMAVTAQFGIMIINGSLGVNRSPQPGDTLPWIRPSIATGFGMLAMQTFNNATGSKVSLLATGLVIGGAAFAPTVAQLAGMATKARDAIARHPGRDFQ